MSAGDTARANYQSAREELIKRIELRDNVLLLFLGFTGTIFGIALGATVQPEILLIIPFLALGASTIVAQHNSIIGSLGYFLVRELEPFIRSIGEFAPQWDGSRALFDNPSKYPWSGRRAAHLVLLVVPPIAALLFNWKHSSDYSAATEFVLWWIGVILTIMVVLEIWASDRWRSNRYRGYGNNGGTPPLPLDPTKTVNSDTKKKTTKKK